MTESQPERAFDRITSAMPSPMLIATTRHLDQLAGCLVGFSTQCSIDPFRYLVCLSKANLTYATAADASVIAVHILHADDHGRALAELFGEETGHDIDKFARCRWRPGPEGVPVLEGCDWFAGTVLDRIDLGDHVGFVVVPTSDGRAQHTEERSLTLRDVSDLEPGNPA